MKKLLTVYIPTYKRPITLRRCIDSVVSQVEQFSLSGDVDIYVADDASPDDTARVLQLFEPLSYFKGVTRDQNLGMNVNIKTMFIEIKEQSDYQLIITDDYLQPDILGDIVEFLRAMKSDNNEVPAIWTPRYSYTEDGDLNGIYCSPFKASRAVKPSAVNAIRYMPNGFVLSGLILRADFIDYEFWDQYSENGYFPVIFFGDLLFRYGAFYWHKNLVHHTVLNECHWERWGKNDVVIRLKLFTDYVNAYGIMANRTCKVSHAIPFYIFSFKGILGSVRSLLGNNAWQGNQPLLVEAINEFKSQGVPRFELKLRLMSFFALILLLITSAVKLAAHLVLLLLTGVESRKKRHRKAMDKLWNWARSAPAIFRLILT